MCCFVEKRPSNALQLQIQLRIKTQKNIGTELINGLRTKFTNPKSSGKLTMFLLSSY